MSDIKFLLNFAQQGDLKKTISDLKALNSELQKNEGLQKRFGDSFSQATKSVTSNLDEIARKTKTAQDSLKTTSDAKEILKLTKEIESLRKEYDKLVRSTTDMAIANEKLAQQTQKTEQQVIKTKQQKIKLQQQEEKQAKKTAQEQAKLNSVYAMESARLNDLRKKYKDMALSEQGASKEARVLLKEITALDNKLKKVDASVGQFQRNVGNYGSALRGFGGQLLSIAGIGGFSAVMTSAIKVNAEFNQSMADLKAITGASDEQLKFFRETAINQASSLEGSTASATQYTEALKLIASAKPELLENERALAQITDQALILADASGLELPDAATRLTDAMNQFGAGADQAGKFVDVLAAGAKYGSAEIPQITEALLEFGAVAKSSNVSIQESTAVIEALAERGIKGSEAGTKLRNVLISLSAAKGLDKAALDSFAKAGVNVDILSDNSLSLETRLKELSKIENDNVAMLKVFGKENLVAAKTVLDQKDRIAELTKMVDENGVAQEQAAIRTNTLAGEWQKLGNAWDAEMLKMGQSGGDLTKLLKFVRENLGTILTTIGKLAKAFIIFKTFQVGMKLFSTATDVATTSFKNLNAAMKANVIALVAVGVYELLDALGAFETEADRIAAKIERQRKEIEENNAQFDEQQDKKKKAFEEERQELEKTYNFQRDLAEKRGEDVTKIERKFNNEWNELAANRRDQLTLEAAQNRKIFDQKNYELEVLKKVEQENENTKDKQNLVDYQRNKNLLAQRIENAEVERKIAYDNFSKLTADRKGLITEITDFNDAAVQDSVQQTAEETKAVTEAAKEQKAKWKQLADERKRIELDLRRYLEDLQVANIEDERQRELETEKLKYKRELESLDEKYEKMGKLSEEQKKQRDLIEQELQKANRNKLAEINKKFDDEDLKREREKLETLNEIRAVNLEEETFLYESFLDDQNQARDELREEYANAQSDEERKRIEENFEFNTQAIEESMASEYELRKKAIEEQRDFELTNTELTEEEKQLIKEQSDLELLKLETQYNKGLEKLSDERLENTETENKKREEQFKKTVEDLQELTRITFDEIEKRVNANIDGIERDISAQEENINRQRELAEQGLENTLAFEKQVAAEQEARLLEEQRRLEKIKKVEAYFNLLSEYAKEDPNSAPAKALAQIAIAEAIAARFEDGGIVADEVAKQNNGILKGNSHKHGGILIEAEGDEGILSKKEMRNLGKDNFYSLKSALKKPVEGTFLKNQNESMMAVLPQQKLIVDFGRVERKLESVKEAIENKPVPTFTMDRNGNLITKSETKKMIKTTVQKRSRF